LLSLTQLQKPVKNKITKPKMEEIMRKSIMRLGASALATVCMLVAGIAVAEPLKLRLSVESTPGASTQHMLASFRDALKQEMGNDVDIEYFDSGTLGDEIVHMQQVRTGQLDVIPIGSDAVQLDSKFAVFDIPFLFSSREQVSALLDGPIGDELDKSLPEKRGTESSWIWGNRFPADYEQCSACRDAGGFEGPQIENTRKQDKDFVLQNAWCLTNQDEYG
jgi:hypothetical protein